MPHTHAPIWERGYPQGTNSQWENLNEGTKCRISHIYEWGSLHKDTLHNEKQLSRVSFCLIPHPCIEGVWGPHTAIIHWNHHGHIDYTTGSGSQPPSELEYFDLMCPLASWRASRHRWSAGPVTPFSYHALEILHKGTLRSQQQLAKLL